MNKYIIDIIAHYANRPVEIDSNTHNNFNNRLSELTLNDLTHFCFLDDEEKMRDFTTITKEEFLNSYSYLSEAEYDITSLLLSLNKTDTNTREIVTPHLGKLLKLNLSVINVLTHNK